MALTTQDLYVQSWKVAIYSFFYLLNVERIIGIEKSTNRISTTEIFDWHKMLKPLDGKIFETGYGEILLVYPNDHTWHYRMNYYMFLDVMHQKKKVQLHLRGTSANFLKKMII